jgi:hypothetical protein
LPEALRVAAAIENCPAHLLGESGRVAPEIEELSGAAAALRAHVHEHPGEFGVLESGRTRFELFRGRMQATTLQGMSGHGRGLLLDREYAWAIAEGIWFVLNWLQRFRESTGTA